MQNVTALKQQSIRIGMKQLQCGYILNRAFYVVLA